MPEQAEQEQAWPDFGQQEGMEACKSLRDQLMLVSLYYQMGRVEAGDQRVEMGVRKPDYPEVYTELMLATGGGFWLDDAGLYGAWAANKVQEFILAGQRTQGHERVMAALSAWLKLKAES